MTYDYQTVITPASGLRLHLNENTAGCSPKVLAALHALTREQASFYPNYERAIAACATRFGVRPDEVMLTNGLDEGILSVSITALRGQVLPQHFSHDLTPAKSDKARPDPEAIVVVPAFDMYAACADVAGGQVVEVPIKDDFSFPTDRVLGTIRPDTRLIFLTNPNNPTGQAIPRADILRIARAAPDALIFVDEAYADFAGVTLINDADARELPNLVVGRTFAKAYGIAGLRAGALIGHPDVLATLRRAVPPFSLNICATVALCAGLTDTEYYDWYLDQVRASKQLLYDTCDRLGVRYWRSAANFVLVSFGNDAQRIVDGLTARQVFVRDRSRDPACPGCVRITTGIVEHTQAGLKVLEEVLCGAP
jgi:histidinol-phosphate aminotransferase